MALVRKMITAIFSVGFFAVAHADPIPERTKDFTGNYKTLMKDHKASAQVATCVTGYDLMRSDRVYNRIGFTKYDIAAAKIASVSKFSVTDPKPVRAVVSVSGEVRNRASGTAWDKIILRCGFFGAKIAAIELMKSES